MRLVAALGGNALLERGESPDAGIQEAHVTSAVTALTPVLRHGQLLITHGNGPQVGVLAVESAGDRALSHPYPCPLGAQTQGMIGYWLAQALSIAIPGRQVGRCRSGTRPSARSTRRCIGFSPAVFYSDAIAHSKKLDVAASTRRTVAAESNRPRSVATVKPSRCAGRRDGTRRR